MTAVAPGASSPPCRATPVELFTGAFAGRRRWAITNLLFAVMRLDMSDDELEQDELESAEDEGEELAAADDGEADEDPDGESERVVAPGKKTKAAVDVDELPSVEAKQKERDALAQAMAEFLSRGGQVQEVEPNVVADPPKKPESKYGSRPI